MHQLLQDLLKHFMYYKMQPAFKQYIDGPRILHCWPKSCVTDQNLDLIHSHFKTDRVMSFIF